VLDIADDEADSAFHLYTTLSKVVG
jgi:hypothetical protein